MTIEKYIKILFSLLFTAFVVTACSSTSTPLLILTDGVQAEGLVDLTPCVYKLNKVKYKADCGTLVVPENRSDPGARLISLPVIRVLALNESPAEPIFWLAGGPGGTNLNFPGLDGLIADHDIILVGYRGMDGMSRLDCPEIGKAATGLGKDLFSNSSLENFGSATIQCAERLHSEGVDLDGYSIPEVIDDMEDARSALGYERVNLLSASYGTRVAMIYSWMHPESLNRSAMIAVNPPGHFVWEPSTIDGQIAYDAVLCTNNPDCSTRTDDLTVSMRNVLKDMPKSWLLIPIDPSKVRFITHFMLFHRGTAATVFDTYLAAEAGDPSGLALLSLAYDFMIPSLVTWGDWIAKGSIDYDPGRDWIVDMNSPDSILGSPTSLLVGGAAQLRGGWPVAPMPNEFREVQPTDVETLLVSGSIDYSTPAQFVNEELLPVLMNSEHVILAEFGHFNDLWGLQTEATRHLLVTFFNNGEVDVSLFTYQPMDFRVGLGFPELAKIALTVVVVVIIVLVVLVRFVARRVRWLVSSKRVPVPEID